MDRKTENQLRQEIAEVWALLDAERAGRAALIRRIEQERDELRKDAERYRWLRDGNDNKKSAACHIAVNCYGLEWDDAIDAAIAQGKGE